MLAVAHSSRYGGAGYTASNLATVAGGNGSAAEVAIHEFGHSLGDLADEYDYGGPETYTGGEPPDANVSVFNAAMLASMQRKWFRKQAMSNAYERCSSPRPWMKSRGGPSPQSEKSRR